MRRKTAKNLDLRSRLRRLLHTSAAFCAMALFAASGVSAGGGGQCGFCYDDANEAAPHCPDPGSDLHILSRCDSECGYGSGFEYECTSGSAEGCDPTEEVYIICGAFED